MRRPTVLITLALIPLFTSCRDSSTSPHPSSDDHPLLSESGSVASLVLTEIMIDPEAVSDVDGEWFEVYNPGAHAVDLKNAILASGSDSDHAIGVSVIVPAREYAVLTREADPALNGGIDPDYVYGTGIQFANSADWLALRSPDGTLADSVYWGGSMLAGASRSVEDPAKDNTNVRGGNWYSAQVEFDAGDRGTPGAPNDTLREGLYVYVIDAGQADANYIETPGSRVVIDAGRGMARMADLITEFGLPGDTIDFMILSHAHFDHHGGMREFFKSEWEITIRHFYENKDASSSSTLAELRDSVTARAGRGELDYRDTDDPCADGSDICTFSLDGGVTIHIMKPKPSGSVNDRSVPVKLIGPDSAAFTMWFSGDAEHPAMAFFEDAGYHTNPGMDVRVLKGNHHGSCNGVTRRFLELVTPEWVTFGVSSTNSFGHVHTQTKDLLSELSVPWYRSDENGRIAFHTTASMGGYTVTVEKGVAIMDGAGDEESSQEVCGNL